VSVVGIDLSSRALHLITLAEDTNDAYAHVVRLDTTRGAAVERIRRMRDRMPVRSSYSAYGVTLIAIEKPFHRQAAMSAVPSMVYGALLQLVPADLPLLELRADDWRRECALPLRGARSELKKASVRFARQMWEACPHALDDDTAEAFCIAWAAREIQLRTEAAA